MMKKALLMLLVFLMIFTAVSCGTAAMSGSKEGGQTTSDETPAKTSGQAETPTEAPSPSDVSSGETAASAATDTPTEQPTTEEPPAEGIVASIISSKNDYNVTQSGQSAVTVKGKAKPTVGDIVTATIPGHYLKVKASGQATEALLYLPEGVFTYEYRGDSSVYMNPAFSKSPLNFTFTVPTEEELLKEHNLAVNPYDYYKGEVTAYPHAETNNVYDTSGQFIARNAIDGYSSNTAHGNYPYQSWGPKATVLSTDHFTVELGREATVTSIELYLRADGFSGSHAHDAFFSEITLEFSDGTSVVIHPEKTASKQVFTFDAVQTSFVKLTGFVTDKSNSDGWAAITEVRVMGCDVPAPGV